MKCPCCNQEAPLFRLEEQTIQNTHYKELLILSTAHQVNQDSDYDLKGEPGLPSCIFRISLHGINKEKDNLIRESLNTLVECLNTNFVFIKEK